MNSIAQPSPTQPQLADALAAVRAELISLYACLDDARWMGPQEAVLNPPLWEFAHIAWFQEFWLMRWRGWDDAAAPSLLHDADARFNSAILPHDKRWSTPFPPLDDVRDYAASVLTHVCEGAVKNTLGSRGSEFLQLALFHEAMHVEATWMAWQHLAYPAPRSVDWSGAQSSGFARVDAGEVELGAPRDTRTFVFDNEKWAHRVRHSAFEIARGLVTEGEFAQFVEAGGYANHALWSDAGREWLVGAGATLPRYWERCLDRIVIREFDRVRDLDAARAMRHVNFFEAQAYARWVGARLPTAAEWQAAAQTDAITWGDAFEWTDTWFLPYPGFAPDPYKEYSAPWFGTHRELRGASPLTHAWMRRPTFRNFYTPERRDGFFGFRLARDAG